MERRFQPLIVQPPDEEETVSILRGLRERFEVHHGITISEAAIVAAVKFSSRYISDRFQPDKSIDLIDEACALLRTEIDSMPAELDDLKRKKIQMEIEFEGCKRKDSGSTKEELRIIEEKLEKITAEYDGKIKLWERDKKAIEEVKKLRKEIEKTKLEIEVAEREYDLSKVSELKYGKLANLENELKDAQDVSKNQNVMITEVLTEKQIAEVVSRWTGIPVSSMTKSEKEKILSLSEKLSETVIGQNHAIESVSRAILRSRAGLTNPQRPLGSFIFVGPTGVGKTELARRMAAELFDSMDNIVRIDMSEYMERHSVSRLIGAPPGYVGYDEGGQLTEAVRRKPYSIILLDEIEKAHDDVFNILLQILEDGRLTDNQGRTVSFKNTIIIMTSNLGGDLIQTSVNRITDESSERVNERIRAHFKPEFLNRIDDIVIFNPLGRMELRKIVGLMVRNINSVLSDRKISVSLSERAVDKILEDSFDAVYGARPVRRYLEKNIEKILAVKILKEELGEGDSVVVDVSGDRFSVEVEAKP